MKLGVQSFIMFFFSLSILFALKIKKLFWIVIWMMTSMMRLLVLISVVREKDYTFLLHYS